MKRFFSGLALLILLAVCATGASAGENATIYRRDEGAQYMISALGYMDSTLYLFTSEDVYYTWDRDSGDLTGHPFFGSIIKRADKSYIDFRSVIQSGGSFHALMFNFESEGDAYVLDEARLFRIVLGADTASFEDPVTLDWAEMTIVDGASERSNEVLWPFISGNRLAFATYGDEGDRIMVYDLTTGAGRGYAVGGGADFCGFCPYGDGAGLVATYPDGEGEPYGLHLIDLSTGESRMAGGIAPDGDGNPTNLYCDAGTDAVYYVLNGSFCRMTGFDDGTAEALSSAQIDPYFDLTPVMTDEGELVLANWETVLLRGTGGEARAERSLTVCAEDELALTNAYYAFSNRHPDVAVKVTTGSGDIIEAMLTRSDAVDIYVARVDSGTYAALKNRGYLADLSGSAKLAALVGEMYPDIGAAARKGGALVALPVRMDARDLGYRPEALSALGLTGEDVPATWMELFMLLQRFPALAGDGDVSAFDPAYSLETVRGEVLDGLMGAYALSLEKGGRTAFDTQELRVLLAEFEQIDFSALGLSEEGVDGYDPGKILFEIGMDFSCFGDSDPALVPAPLALAEGEEAMIGADLIVAFVNPYSESIDLAAAYLEDAADSLDAAFLADACPGRNEPIPNASYEQTLKYFADEIALIDAALAEADADDQAEREAERAIYQRAYDESVANGRWSVSTEDIAAYRRYADCLRAKEYLGMDAGEIFDEMRRYLGGAIDAGTMLRNIDQKLDMMRKEGM